MPPLPPDGPGDGELERRLRRLRVRSRPAAPPDTASLDADVKPKVSALMDSAYVDNVPLTVGEVGRTQARQDSLYGIGRQPNDHRPPVTWTRDSQHTKGRAVDFRVNNDLTGADPGYAWLRRTAPKVGLDVPIPVNDPGHVEDSGPDQPDQAAAPADSTLEQRLARLRQQAPAAAPTPRPQPQTPVAGRGISMTPEQARAGQERQQGFAEGAKNVALGVPRFLASTTKGALSYTPEELRREDIRDYVRSHGQDPDQLLHEALRARGRGESLGPLETGATTAVGMGRMGYDLQRAAQGGALWERGPNGPRLVDESPDMSTGERIQHLTELAGNAALFGAGAGESGPLGARIRAAAERVRGLGGRRPATPNAATSAAADAGIKSPVMAEQAAPTPPPARSPHDELVMEAARLSAREDAHGNRLPPLTEAQRARLRELSERIKTEGQAEPPPPPVEQSAFAKGNEEPPPIPRDIVERERQRPELEASGRIPKAEDLREPPTQTPYGGEERRTPGDRRLDETVLIDEEADQRRGERRQPATSRAGEERRDLGSRPAPQGEERRTFANPEDYEVYESKQAPALYDPGAMEENPHGYDPEPPIQGVIGSPEKVIGEVPANVGRLTNADIAEQAPSAIRLPNGQIFRGANHGEALNKAIDAKALDVEAVLGHDYEQGFMNRGGTFDPRPSSELPRPEAKPEDYGLQAGGPYDGAVPAELPPLPELAGPATPGPRPPKARPPELPAAPDELAAHEAARQPSAAPYDFASGNAQRLRDMQARKLAEQQQPPSQIDPAALDARIQALRDANAKLEQQAAAVPTPRANMTAFEGAVERRARNAKARENAEAAAGMAHETLLRERAVVERQLTQAKDELSRYPTKGRPRPALKERLDALKTTIADYEARVEDLNKRIKDISPRFLDLDERGFVINPFGRNKLAQPSPRQRALLPPEVRAVLDHVAVGERAPFRLNLTDTLQQWFWETSRPARSLERAAMKAGVKLPLDQRPLVWMKAALDSPTRVGGWLLKEGAGPGRWDSQGNWQLTGTPSFEAALEPIRGDPVKVSLWRARLVAEHAPEIEAAGFDTGIPKAEAAAVAAMQLPPEVARAVKYSHDLLNDALQYGVDAGAYTPGLQQVLRTKYQQYVPFQRAFEGEGSSRTGTGGPTNNLRGPVRKLKGSERPVVDPAETIPDYVARMVRYADIYRAARATINLIEAQPGLFEGMAKKVGSAPLKSVGQATQALGQLLSDRALSLEGDRITLANSKTGTLDTYQVDPIIGDMLRGLGSKEYGLANELIFGMWKKGVTFGVTNNPVFGVIINPIRDALGRPTMSTATLYPGQGTASAAWNVISKSPEFKKFRSMGGGFGLSAESGGGISQLARAAGGRGARVGAQMASQARAAKFVGKRSVIRPGLPIDILKSLSLPAEQMGRFAEFRTVKARGRSIYGDETMSDLEAHMHTQETMGNFAEHGTGAAIRLLAHNTPFLNPALQGTRAFGAAMRRNPGRFVAAGIATITLPTVALYYLNRDDKEIQDQRQSAGGYLNWYYRVNDHTILKVPKPFGAGAVFGTAVEHALDAYFEHDPDAAERGFADFWKEMAPNFVPPTAGLAYSLGTNRDLYSGTPIVPNEQQGNLPEYQTGRHPSPTMNRVGQALGASPAKLKFGTRALGGSGTSELLNLLDRTTHGDELPAMRKPDLPFVGRLYARTPTSAAAPIRDVYSESNAPASVLTTLQYLARKGQTAELQRFVQEHKEELPRAGVAQGFVQAMSQLADQAELLEGLQQLTPEQRADKRDEILRVMTTLADKFHPILHRLAAEEDLAKRNRPR